MTVQPNKERGYCLGSMTQPPLSLHDLTRKQTRCVHCGRTLKLRVNGYGTYLGLPRHKTS